MTRRWTTWTLAFVLLVPLAAVAQEAAPSHLTWIGFSKYQSGKLGDAVQFIMEDADLMEGLLADGTILGWGLLTPINHRPGDAWNFVEYVNVADWAGVETWVGAVMARMQAADPETQAEQLARAKEIFVEGSHFDEVVYNAHASGPGSAPPRYFYTSLWRTKPDQGGAMMEVYDAHVAPALSELQASGGLVAYGVHVPLLHGVPGDWTHRIWYGLPSLAAVDGLQSTLDSLMTPELRALASGIFEDTGHQDTILMALHIGGGGAGGEE